MKKWNLDALFTSFDSEEFKDNLQKINELIETATKDAKASFVDMSDAEAKIVRYLETSSDLRSRLLRAFAYCSLRISTDTSDQDAKKYMNHLQQLSAKTTYASTTFTKWLPNVEDLDALIEKNPLLKEAEYYLHRIVEGAKHVLSDKEEMIIAKMQNTGSSAWSQLQGELTSTLKIPFDGKELSLSEIKNLGMHKDQDVRKRAYLAEMEAYPKIAQSVAYAMNGVKGEVNTLVELRNFDSPLDQAVYQSRMERETLDALLGAMKEYLPVFRQFLKRKATLLGHKNGLPWYDLGAPMGESSKEFSEDEAMEYIFKNFKTFGPSLENLARRAYDEEWIDFTPRNGKRGGAFCSNIHPIKQSRILTNFSGSFGNVITLAHELGHAYHGDKIFAEKIFNASYTMPVAETASTFCETIVKNAALNDAKEEEKINILEESLKGSTAVIVDIMSRFIFEENVFNKRQETPLSVEMLNEMMLDAQKEAYGDALDPDFMHQYAWLNKPHYYRGGLSFYNFPYAYGLLFAKGIYAEFKKRGSAFTKDVDLLLQKTGQKSIEDVAALVGLDVRDKDFWRQSLDVIKAEIDMFLELTE